MEKITRSSVTELLENKVRTPAVTIYCPTHTAASPPHMTEDQIRFKNLMNKAIEELNNKAEGQRLADELSSRRDELLADQEFWEGQCDGMLICAQAGSIRLFQLPIDTEEYVAVDDTFHLAPVLGLIQDSVEFYVLSVAQHQPALYKGDMYELQATNVDFPQNIESALDLDEVNQKSEHARSATGSSVNTSGFHGRGGARDPHEEDRARFFRLIDKIVCTHTEKSLPLILAGTESETAEFRQLSKYPKILKNTVAGNHNKAKPGELFDSVKAIIQQEIIDKHHQEAIDEYQMLKGANPDRVATDKETITQAAEQGRIDKLLVRMVRYTTDTVRDTKDSITRITFPEDGLSSAINKLAAKVWQTSGKIIGLEASNMPDGAPMVARLRY